jgi:hypothetical protein
MEHTLRWLIESSKICEPPMLGEYIFGSYCYHVTVTVYEIQIQKGYHTKTGQRYSTPPIIGIWRVCNSQELRDKHVISQYVYSSTLTFFTQMNTF